MKRIIFILCALIGSVCTMMAQTSVLTEVVKEMNTECPMEIDNDLTLTGLSLTTDYLVLDCLVDETDIDIPTLRQHKGMLRDSFAEMFSEMIVSDSDIFTVAQCLYAEGKGVKINMRGQKSGQTVNVIFTPGEISNYFKSRNLY